MSPSSADLRPPVAAVRGLGLLAGLSLSLTGRAIEPVQQPVPQGVVDWSSLRLELTVASQQTRGAWQDRRLQEQDAMDRLRTSMLALAGDVCIVPGTDAAELIAEGGALGERLKDGLGRWEVEEARYFSQGGVELIGALDLRAWLWPALVELSAKETLPPTEDGDISGLVVDARGLTFPLCVGPILRTHLEGPPLSTIADFSAELARRQTPALYVRDPADPRAAARAGAQPLLVRAVEIAPDGGIVVSPEGVAAMQASSAIATLINRGNIVIVVDP